MGSLSVRNTFLRGELTELICAIRRWNAARSFASYLDAHPELYRARSVLELGAGGGLPGLVAAKNGAQCVRD